MTDDNKHQAGESSVESILVAELRQPVLPWVETVKNNYWDIVLPGGITGHIRTIPVNGDFAWNVNGGVYSGREPDFRRVALAAELCLYLRVRELLAALNAIRWSR